MGILFWILVFAVKDVFCLKNVTLTIEPRIVQYLSSSILRCSYDLEDDVLYSVKWYRGQHEFYRYTPKERPTTKVFPSPYAGINVDVNKSNSTQVVLRDIEFNLSGNFSCEVTTDSPHIHIGTDTKSMLVVQLPEIPPKISVGRGPLDVGDALEANCTSPPSRPPATLTFILNNFTVAQSELLSPKRLQERNWSDLPLKMVLSDFHFSEGRLVLRCVADVTEIYHEEAELELASARNPVPQRVRGLNYAVKISETNNLLLYGFLFALILLWKNK